MEWGLKALANGNDLEARAQVQWSSIVALNGWVQVGVGAGYPVHMIEHVLSAHHDITHAAGLAVVNPAWMRFAAKSRPSKFVQFAERIFGLQAKQADDMDCALEGIHRFEELLRSIGCPTRLSELGIDDKLVTRYAQDTVRIIHDDKGFLPGRPPMSEADIEAVLRSAL
jgi:alcohol dehydrogenase